MKSILIYNKENKKYKDDIIKFNNKIYLLYDGKFINPPFFDKIIVIHDNLDDNDLKMIYNMVNINGSLLFIEKYKKFFINCIKKKDLFIITKKNNFQYQIPYCRIVDFIIIGAQKAGTTALSLNIGLHPDIYINRNKDPRKSEVHFFDIYWKRGIDYYKKQFDYSKKMVGEKTPDLLYLTYTFPLIQSVNPYVKLIIILRNPIERAYSSWKLAKEYFNETNSFENAIQNELESKQNITFYTAIKHYLQRGLYYKQINELFKWFPRFNILILLSEDVKNNMEKEYNKVYEFLNLKNIKVNYNLEFESKDKSKIEPELYKKLILYYKDDVKNLEKLLNIKTNWF